MPELGLSGSVRGARGNSRPYRDDHRPEGFSDRRVTPVYWKPSFEISFYLSSHPIQAKTAAAAVRKHWGIENV
jgi:hypothetical protein